MIKPEVFDGSVRCWLMVYPMGLEGVGRHALTNRPAVFVLQLLLANEDPDAGEPVREHGEHGHQQRQDDVAVLRVAVQSLHESGQTQQSRHLQQWDVRALHSARITTYTRYASTSEM